MPKKERTELHRKLREINRQLQWPAVYSDRRIRREFERERLALIARIRELPLAV